MHFYLMWSDIYNMIHSQLARVVFKYLHVTNLNKDLFGYSDIKIQVKRALFLLELYPKFAWPDQNHLLQFSVNKELINLRQESW